MHASQIQGCVVEQRVRVGLSAARTESQHLPPLFNVKEIEVVSIESKL